jgi:hypothetical protein
MVAVLPCTITKPVWNAHRPVSVLQSTYRSKTNWRSKMPIILWLVGVPLSLIIILALFGAF